MLRHIRIRLNYLYVLPLVLVTILSVTACLGRPDSSTQLPPTPTPMPTPEPSGRGTGGTLRILYWQPPEILNPHLTTSTKDMEVSRITYEPLASFDKEGNLIPFLAAEIPSLENGGVAPDGKSATWRLKQDVSWSDGEPFTADDVLFTYQFITNPETEAKTVDNYSDVESVEVIDDYTVKVNFKEVNPAWASPFVGIWGVILPRHKFEVYNGPNAMDAPANLMPVGTGPYQLVTFKPEEVLFLGTELVQTNKLVFEPNPHFREEDKPFFSRVELKGGGTVNEAARSVLKTGDVDYAWNLQVDAEMLAELGASGKGQVIVNPGARVERIVLNFSDPDRETEEGERSSLQFSHPFFSDEKMRQAFAYTVDRDTIASLYLEGQATSNLLVAPLTYNSPNTSYEFNLEKAAAMLDEAGWHDTDGDGVREKDGVKLSVHLQTSSNQVRQQTQEIVKSAIESIGVQVRLEVIDTSTFFDSDPSNPKTLWHFYADMEEYQTGNRSPDPGSYMKTWTCSQIPQKANNWSGLNLARWCNSEYDALYEASTRELDPETRRQIFIQMNDMLIQEVVVIPLVTTAQVAGASKTLVGVDPTPWDSEMWNIKDWRRDES
jgi:peptide/nickel transport system substrate-binding protein